MFADLLRDIKYGARSLAKNPGFATVAVLTLALGIGANTVIFSAFNAVMLRPLPYTDPDRVVTVWDSFVSLGAAKFGVAYLNFMDMKERTHVYEPLALYQAASNTTYNLTGVAGPERIQGTRATGDFFRALNVSPLIGRTIAVEDEEPGRNHVVVLSYSLWQRDFGGDPLVIDRSLKLNDEDYRVIGVMPHGFEFPSGPEMPAGQQFASATELWVPLTIPPNSPLRQDRVAHSFRAVARLKPGVTAEQARAETISIVQQLVAEHPQENQGLGASVITLKENQVGAIRPALWSLLVAVCFVLLIACANIANLLLSRAAVRRKEFTVRAALGASRRRIVQQLLTESLLLSAIGGALGLLLSVVAIRFLIAFVPGNIPRMNEVSVDFRVLAFTVSVSLLTGILFGIVPALHSSRLNLYEGVKSDGRGLAGATGQHRLRNLLVISEVGLVLILLIAGCLMLRSFRRLLEVTPGFDPQHVLAARVTLPPRPYPGQKKAMFYHQLLDRVAQTPGVQAAAAIRDLPLSGTDPRYGVTVEGRSDAQQANGGYTIRLRVISPDYFKVMGVPVKQGRPFTDHDDQNAPAVSIINESAARQIFPGENPIGKVLQTIGGYAADKVEVVGVVGDVKFGGLDSQLEPELYINYPKLPEAFIQAAIGSMALVVRGTGEPSSLTGQLRQQVAAIDQNIPLTSMQTMDDQLAHSLAPRKFNLMLLVVFGVVSLLLAAVGIYGVLSYWVAQRLQEIGIRMALGAQAFDIFKLVVFQAMSVVSIGLGIGVLAAIALTRVLSNQLPSLLFGVKATDPATFVWMILLLAATAFAACYFPARRAIKVEPTIALRAE